MSARETLVRGASAVAIDGRALMIEGAPGSGKSSLALALIERGAALIGDDGVALAREGDSLIARAPPHISGLLEVRGVGLIELPLASPCPLALILTLGAPADRLPDRLEQRTILGCDIPVLPFELGSIVPAERAKWALHVHGLAR